MSYVPEVNHYVYLDDCVKGWVYFKCEEYITIEMGVKPKTQENYKACSIHSNDRFLVLCYRDNWNKLKFIKSRDFNRNGNKND